MHLLCLTLGLLFAKMGHLKKYPDNLVMFSDVQGQLIDGLYTSNISACVLCFRTFQIAAFDLSNSHLYTFLNV